MSRRHGSSRSLHPVKQCSVYVRGMLHCAWCWSEFLERSCATIDHLDGDPTNNAPENLVPACWRCNRAREDDWTRGEPWTPAAARALAWSFDLYLERHDVEPEMAYARVEAQRWLPLPRAEGRTLALLWHPTRMAYLIERAATRLPVLQERCAVERLERLAIQSTEPCGEMSFP